MLGNDWNPTPPRRGFFVRGSPRANRATRYEWSADGAEVNFELHGEELGATEDFTSYEKGVSAGKSGSFRAPFDGTHGWYWRNRTGSPISVTVKASGVFSNFALVD